VESSAAAPSEMVPPREPIASELVDVAGRRAVAGSSAAVSTVPRPAASRWLLAARASDQRFLPIETRKYVMLLDWTGREMRRDKRGAIPEDLAPILDRLGVDRSNLSGFPVPAVGGSATCETVAGTSLRYRSPCTGSPPHGSQLRPSDVAESVFVGIA
jgi:hypothetical protein